MSDSRRHDHYSPPSRPLPRRLPYRQATPPDRSHRPRSPPNERRSSRSRSPDYHTHCHRHRSRATSPIRPSRGLIPRSGDPIRLSRPPVRPSGDPILPSGHHSLPSGQQVLPTGHQVLTTLVPVLPASNLIEPAFFHQSDFPMNSMHPLNHNFKDHEWKTDLLHAICRRSRGLNFCVLSA